MTWVLDAPPIFSTSGRSLNGSSAEVGIHNEADLRTVGAVEAWHRLRFAFGRQINRNALHALEAALNGIPWGEMSAEMKPGVEERAAVAASRRPCPQG